MGILGFSQAHAADDPAGYWMTEKNESQIHITHCGDKLCGNIFWMKDPNDAAGKPKLDRENEDEAKRVRPILGLQLITMKSDDDVWRGSVYNPTNGKTYDATLKFVGKSQIELKGCVAYILCGGQKWLRTEPKAANTAETVAGRPAVTHVETAHTGVHKAAAPGAPAAEVTNPPE